MKLFSEPSDALDSLSSADRGVAELKALVGDGLSKTAFLEVVRGAGVPAPDARGWTAPKLQESVQRLVKKRVLKADEVIDPAWRDPLTLRVVADPDGRLRARLVRAAAPRSWRELGHYNWRHSWPYFDADLARAARLMALADEPAELERLIEISQDEAKADGRDLVMAPLLLAGAPSDVDFLDALSPDTRDRVASAHVVRLLDHGLVE